MKDTSSIGNISVSVFIAELSKKGYSVLLPLGDHYRYDLVTEKNNKFTRIQVKTGRYKNGAVAFWTCSQNRTGKKWRKSYEGDIDLFGVYCPELNTCYLVPVNDVGATQAYLRVDPPKNNIKNKIRLAEKYILR